MTPDLYLDLYHERYGPEFYGTGQAGTAAVAAGGSTVAPPSSAGTSIAPARAGTTTPSWGATEGGTAAGGTYVTPSSADTLISGNDGRTS